MNRLIAALATSLCALLATGNALAADAPGAEQAAADSKCQAAAIDKNGKPLAGAAKSSFMRKCHADAMRSGCEARALSKDGKPLSGAAKNSFMRKCEEDAKPAE
jgi:opacity protein-like surface antigen